MVSIRLTDAQLQEANRFPAVRETTYEVYFLKDNQVLCEGSIGSSWDNIVTVYLRKPEAFKALANDFAVKRMGYHAGFRFSGLTGTPLRMYMDEPDDRLDGITIVDKNEFENGYCGPRYHHIRGYAKTALVRRLSNE